ncbi:flagellar hook-associated protein FlgK [Siminovitchia fortis]|uniref:Flagellar hook-associated protein 1 n=1 Tax=Siminovitchia fortis TaxID=254758 RepID=A0A443IZ89_9BACI|nr:flagellar hook-associated protein FlgK [Siminovitchia fortis]RWR13588.1 flagellar hook-associated protein FlgK [Siminovitchia fortis]WHY81955.1 flagellar hook-associated protein FlgK [Siminovitchia fortis]
MSSTFHGLETARRALNTQQAGLYTTGHNVANANTPGYTRQRINMQASEAYPPASMNRPMIPGQIGTGVSAGSIQRIRESFLDTQYRKENAKLGYFGTNAEALSRLEDILNETGKESTGISRVLNDFWQALQDLSVNPENSGAREVVLERGKTVADTFNHIYNTMEDYRQDLKVQLNTYLNESGKDDDPRGINLLLKNINELNQKIAEVEPLGYVPNDLYDERDLLVDELSKFMDIEVQKVPSHKNPKGEMEGIYVIKMKGDSTTKEYELVSKDFKFAEINVSYGEEPDVVTGLKIGEEDILKDLTDGTLKSLIENYGYQGQEGDSYITVMKELDSIADLLVEKVNGAFDGDFFNNNAGASDLEMILKDTEGLKPEGSPGDGSKALAMADSLKDVMTKYQELIGSLGVKAQYAKGQAKNVSTLQAAVDEKRLSVSAVSLDEEIMNMIKFQHAYNAAARNITVIDEMLDKVINGMGVVGR